MLITWVSGWDVDWRRSWKIAEEEQVGREEGV